MKKMTTAVASLGKANTELHRLSDSLRALKNQDENTKPVTDQVKQALKCGLSLVQLLQKMSAIGVDEQDAPLTFDKIKYTLAEALHTLHVLHG